MGRGLPLCRGGVGVFYSPSRLGNEKAGNINVTVILIVIGSLRIVAKSLEKIGKDLKIRDRIDTI